jgi:hypothetical protein
MRSSFTLAVAVAVLVSTGCGDDGSVFGSVPDTAGSSTGWERCAREDVEGCTLIGVVFTEPMPLGEVLAAAESFGGEAIAVYRTDAVCVPDISFTAFPADPPEQVASRFAYVDAEGIRERRLEANNAGLSPPITGRHISESYWNQWEEEWRLAQQEGVMIAAVALYTAADSAATIARDAGVATVVTVPSRRTDSLDPSYSGELLVESKDFPPGHLDPAPSIDC